MTSRSDARRAPRRASRPMLGLAAVFCALALAACQINWQYNKNFGVAVEPTASRISLAIYRAPRSFLYSVLNGSGPDAVADIIYASGNGPLAKLPNVCVGSVCVGSSTVKFMWHHLIYDLEGDMIEALVNAQNHHDCLALTLISYSQPFVNWTHKSVGCIIGSL